MHIEKINDNKIKVTVNKEDIRIWNVSMKNLTENTPEAQDLFWFALRQAEKDVDFKVGSSQLLVEAHPSNSDGFIMIISKVDEKTNVFDLLEGGRKVPHSQMEIKIKRRTRKSQLVNIFRFEDFEDLIGCTEQIKNMFSGQSALFKYKDGFYLNLMPYDNMNFFETENLLLEYSKRVPGSLITEGILKEHGTEMIKENAIETILAYFN
jgi:adapter protein MecA 1/2